MDLEHKPQKPEDTAQQPEDLREANANIREAEGDDATSTADARRAGNKPRFDRDR